MRNYVDQDFSAIEKVLLTNVDGVQYDAHVIAVCGSQDFIKSYKEFFDIVWEKYNK